jgi:hypothetical protein|tara:strand:+ start:1210 stop:1797 length:588 start_codon:yes stop_codon:yes gene_type:complete
MDEIFNKLIKEKMTPNSLYVLHCIKNKLSVNDLVNSSLEVKRLQAEDWLKEDLSLSGKSIIFIEELTSFFRKSKKKTSKHLMGDNFDVSIKMYNEIFPTRKLNSGKYARTNVKNLEAGFRWFFENYEYSWETVLTATKKYVEEYSLNNYEYMRTSQYFIRKQNLDKSFESDLATYCDMLQYGNSLEENLFKEKIV